jgi:UDP-N-acetyl-D-mannosaminuronate dehydrogenase
VLGLAYTPDAKMHKLSPALDALRCLKDTPRLRLHDPYYTDEEVEGITGFQALSFPDDLAECDGVLLVTPHSAYVRAEVEDSIRSGTVIVDNFGAWRNREFSPGVRYHEVGRRAGEDHRDAVVWPEPSAAGTA